MQEEMHEQMTGYKRMRREHQAALLKVIEFICFTDINYTLLFFIKFNYLPRKFIRIGPLMAK